MDTALITPEIILAQGANRMANEGQVGYCMLGFKSKVPASGSCIKPRYLKALHQSTLAHSNLCSWSTRQP